MAWSRFISSCAVGIVFLAGIQSGKAGDLDRTTEGQNVTVSITSPFSSLPPGGCVPFRINIQNDQNNVGTWQFMFRASTNAYTRGSIEYRQSLTVEPNRSTSFDLLVPMPVVSDDKGNTVLNVGVKGPGFNSSLDKPFFAYFYTNNPGSRLPYTLIESDVLGTIGLGPLTAYCKDAGRDFYGSTIDVGNMPSTWQAYSGVAVLIVKDTGWLSLNSTQREAICDYVAQGGHLTILTAQTAELRTPEMQLPEPDGKPGPYGFGSISVVPTSIFPPDAEVLNTIIEKDFSVSAYQIEQKYSTWGLRRLVGTIAVSGTFILCFVVLFGGLVGPINLFVFAPGVKRFRLFWTTPLISILACLILIVGILVTDGIGGSGRQIIAIFSLPNSNREAIVQEQVARTAVLFSSRWRGNQNYLITPIASRVLNDETTIEADDSPDVYRKDDKDYSGNWFRSRSVCGQYLQAMRPSRSVLTVLNSQAVNSSRKAPEVLSSFPNELTQVFLFDANNNCWTCRNLEPGHKQPCVASSEAEFKSFWGQVWLNAGGKLGPLLYEARDRRDCFYALGTPSSDETLATLGEIRWQVEECVYLGPWVSSSSEEGGP